MPMYLFCCVGFSFLFFSFHLEELTELHDRVVFISTAFAGLYWLLYCRRRRFVYLTSATTIAIINLNNK